jgi:hypothetical protein
MRKRLILFRKTIFPPKGLNPSENGVCPPVNFRKYAPPQGRGISADVIWGENMKRGNRQKEKCEKRKERGKTKE